MRYASISLGNANDSASWTTSSITSGFALLMAALTQVICTCMYHNGPSQYALRANELDLLVRYGSLGTALRIGLEVS